MPQNRVRRRAKKRPSVMSSILLETLVLIGMVVVAKPAIVPYLVDRFQAVTTAVSRQAVELPGGYLLSF